MKIQTIRDKAGDVVATFELEEEGAIAPSKPEKRGFTVKAVEVAADYAKDPGAFYKKLPKAT